MSKHARTPTSRLICLGGAKACTNAVSTDNVDEEGMILGFND